MAISSYSTLILRTLGRRSTSILSKRKSRYVLIAIALLASHLSIYQPEESKKTNEDIEGDRKHFLDAAIVRIMKANKIMLYENLKTATIEAMKNHFAPQVDVIKQRVEYLVGQDYLERDKTEKNKFHYVA